MSSTATSSNTCPAPSRVQSGWLRIAVVIAAVIGLYAVDGPSKNQASARDTVSQTEESLSETVKVSPMNGTTAVRK